nr:casein kinase 1-like protein HD16 [Tanacetum cinerariifolium]
MTMLIILSLCLIDNINASSNGDKYLVFDKAETAVCTSTDEAKTMLTRQLAYYMFLTMTTAGSCWGVVMSRNIGFYDQVVELDFLYPSEGIHCRWESGYRITSMAATPDQAAFILRIRGNPIVVTSAVVEPIKVQEPVPLDQQHELFKWILEEKRKLKPKGLGEKKRIDEEKAILKQLTRAKSIPSL